MSAVRSLLLPFFALRLLFTLFFSVIGLAVGDVRWFPLLPAVVLAGLQIWWKMTGGGLDPQTLLPTPLPPQPPVVLPASLTTVAVPQDKEVLQASYSALRQLYEQQPTHRDVLINLGLVEWYLGHREPAVDYWRQAQDVEPLLEIK